VFRSSKGGDTKDGEETVCENTALTLQCGSNEVIRVLSAEFGGSSALCGTVKCDVEDVLKEVSDECDGERKCEFLVDRDTLKVSSCPGSIRSFVYTYECVQESGSPGFDFSDDCSAGSGEFSFSLTEQGVYQNVGVIPTGTFDLRINLESEQDLDIALFDLDDPNFGTDGKAIVLWCSKSDRDNGENCGFLGGSTTRESGTYQDMQIEYSGYYGVGGRGNEYINIQGMTTRKLMMKVNPYKTGNTKVSYSWGEGCGGRFSVPLKVDEKVLIGEVPAGVTDLHVEMYSEGKNDVDIQLYDKNTKTRGFSEGDAIIAYCNKERETDCNYGSVTDNKATEGEYADVTYKYSGYYGIGGNRGHETIDVEGTTNRALVMQAYGYRAGDAVITYSYRNGA